MNKNKEISTKHKFGKRLNSISIPAEVAVNIVLVLFCLLCIVPFIFVVIISFTTEESIRQIGFSFAPVQWTLDAYHYVMELGDILWRAYFNSFFITVVGTLLSVLICILYAYALFRKDFKYRKFFMFFCFFTMLFGGGLVPTYYVTKLMLGLHDSYAAIVVPMLLNPFNIIIMRTFYQTSVPTELIEAAAIDGSGEYYTFFKIIAPISKPGIATIALMNAIAFWNEWYIPMLYVNRSPKFFPLQYLLYKMQSQADFLARNASIIGTEASEMLANLPTQSLRMALVVMVVLPIACAYPFFQRYIISGLTIGSVKG